jgi:exonuclease SbcC
MTCLQQLSAEQYEYIIQNLAQRVRIKQHQQTRLVTLVHTVEDQLSLCHKRIYELVHTLQTHRDYQERTHVQAMQRAELEAREAALLLDIHKHTQHITLYQAQIQEYAAAGEAARRAHIQAVAQDPFSLHTHAQIEVLAQHIQRHELCAAQAPALAQELHAVQHLATSTATYAQHQEAYRALRRTIQGILSQLHAHKAEQAHRIALHAQHHALIHERTPHIKRAIAQTSQELNQLLQAHTELSRQIGSLEEKHRLLLNQQELLRAEEQKCALLERERDEYTILSAALSKDGMQGMLIEHALPTIEQEANAILGRLTDYQSHIHFDSMRELRNGSAKETLDIKIADTLGTRPYELFSGGEAFRIDLALRLAISKLLAHRSGASIQTLIIDEGFGSQDEEGLHNIMEALLNIQHDFAKIIIVSHLPTMKEQFPVHFHVHKSAEGSTVTVLKQG